jgi:hypothetical protein
MLLNNGTVQSYINYSAKMQKYYDNFVMIGRLAPPSYAVQIQK